MKKTLFITFLAAFLFSCSNDNLSLEDFNPENTEVNSACNKEAYLVYFAKILSKATHERKDIREFLKAEALKQFDKNYDILYYLIKNEEINGSSFRDILIHYSSRDIIEKIETNVPLLNILIPEIVPFGINPEDLDSDDAKTPIAVSMASETPLFLNGEKELAIPKGKIPAFHLFVVNENSRVIIPAGDTRNSTKPIIFKSPNFDGSLDNPTKLTTRGARVPSFAKKTYESFKYFNKDDRSINQKAFQRDYIYYGITPEVQSGSLDRSVSEYLAYIEINPNTYFKIADRRETGSTNDDPYIINATAKMKRRQLTPDELMDRMWTKGSYDFRFEVTSSTNQRPQIVYIPLKPNEIWNFNIEMTQGKKFLGNRYHTYRIDPNKFTSKQVFLKNKISLGKWDLSEESVYRYIDILEEDESTETTFTNTFEMTRVHTSKFNGDVKLEIGLGKSKVTGGASTDITNSNSIKESKNVTVTRKEKSDYLGAVKVYFYDPIVEIFRPERHLFVMHTYDTGHVKFGITAE